MPDPTICIRFVAAIRAEHMPALLLLAFEPGQRYVPFGSAGTTASEPLVCLGLNPYYTDEDREHCILVIAKVASYLVG